MLTDDHSELNYCEIVLFVFAFTLVEFYFDAFCLDGLGKPV